MMARSGKDSRGLKDDMVVFSNGCREEPSGGDGGLSEAESSSKGTAAAVSPQKFTFSPEPSIEDIRRMQADFTDERDWNKFHQPRNLLLAMVGEVGEVAELFQWRGEVAEGLPDWTESEREQLAHELSDVLIYLVELAEKCRVDLPQAVLRKMALNRLKYPASKVHGSAKKYTEYKD
ncbi:glutamyl-tRNA(Gln) amidotransferase subunit B, mitochondrial [Poeciliopsis prolifica]|uniref:glutamyl-tRNA(Gln) amidotransferase subunit B, mitochondrial n=1 Tax=Poeciliopsis prolifica TaxID=188132 RepID=UPI002414199A|nr:glutamyl-tRNA(Gln) amidotransferase subunit B, mitochondrial [Poeciliopsis prolifica]